MKKARIYNKDCRYGMLEMIKNNIKVDLVVTDPPFAIDFKKQKANYNRKQENVLDGYVEIPKEKYDKFSYEWISLLYDVLDKNGSVYIFSGWSNLRSILNAIYEKGFETINHLIWKYNFGVYTKNKYVTSHYHILYLKKPKGKPVFNTYCRFNKDEIDFTGKKLNYSDREDVWYINRKYNTNKNKIPTQLPHEIVEKIIRYSSNENQLVFDPFLGSGTTAIVSKKLNRRVIGFEVCKNYYDFILKNLEE